MTGSIITKIARMRANRNKHKVTYAESELSAEHWESTESMENQTEQDQCVRDQLSHELKQHVHQILNADLDKEIDGREP